MSWEDIFKIVSGLIFSLGGGGAIIWALSSYFGKLWAERNIEKIRKDYQKEIDHYKNELDLIKETSLRYSSQQFEQYTLLWHSLYNLKLVAQELWEEANPHNLERFSKQLKNTIDQIEKSSLFIEDSHYKELQQLLTNFSDYHIGKAVLIRYKSSNNDVNHNDIEKLVRENGRIKHRYEKLIEETRIDLKKQMKG